MVIFHIGMNDAYYHITSHFNPLISFSFSRTFLGKQIKRLFYRITEDRKEQKESSGPIVTHGEEYARKRNSLSRPIKKIFRPESVMEDFAESIKKISKLCKSIDAACLFMTTPCGYQRSASEEYKKGFWMTPPEANYTLDFDSLVYISEPYNNFLIEFAKANNIHIFDLAGEIPASYEYMYDDCHFNTQGARKVADSLYQFLLTKIDS